LLICSSDLAAATLKRLTMFVLRAKVRLTDVTAQFSLKGWVGPALMQAIHTPALTAWQHRSYEGGDLITLYPALGQPRALWLGTPAHPGLAALPSLSLSDWLGLEVLSGIAQVQAATTDAFVPQMLNYESVDGVSFKKGCYPGRSRGSTGCAETRRRQGLRPARRSSEGGRTRHRRSRWAAAGIPGWGGSWLDYHVPSKLRTGSGLCECG
ncbi:MAG: hypothetical protein EBU77_04935, partial [Betaproteobacteria bacterium]|nr:hypothetical protein [Betaproteobacteria bacterium]